ncbi:MAG: Cof-type HAD-IIB family hydrolase [Lachnospiraceae bacterium]|nr:Cof-type HAD-IIB family hydrolase [Lachnospiraceae bacterium]
MDYEMIVLDLDGTLTNRDKVITQRTKEALTEAMKQGKKVILASGRPVYGVMPLAKELRLSDYGGYILAFNGGVIMDCRTEEVVFSRMLPAESNYQIIQLALKNRVDLLTYDRDVILTNNEESSYVQLESRINHLRVRQMEMDELFARLDFSVPKFLMVDDGDYLAMVEPRVKAALGKNFSVYRSEPFFLEILPRGIDKAQSLERLLQKMGLKKEQLIACGDGYNDLSMIRFAGLGVAMANGVLPVRKAADYITASNDEDGVALVVEKFMLGRDHS